MPLRKRAALCCVLLWMAGMLAGQAGAAAETGSISLRLACEGAPVGGGTLTLYRIGEIDGDGYALRDPFRGSGADLTGPGTPETALRLAQYARTHSIPGDTRGVDETGSVRFAPLEPGLYLIAQWAHSPDYAAVLPFLVSIPQTAGESVRYDVDASPKVVLTPGETSPTGPHLPQTGQLNWPVPVMAAAGILLLGAGGLMYFDRCRK